MVKEKLPARIIRFLKEVKREMNKVTWPSRAEVINFTIVVIVACIIFGLYLGLVDFALARGIKILLK